MAQTKGPANESLSWAVQAAKELAEDLLSPILGRVSASSHISPPLILFLFLGFICLCALPWIKSNGTFSVVLTCPKFLPMITSTGGVHLNIKQKYATGDISTR
jgi:hypothetical protein